MIRIISCMALAAALAAPALGQQAAVQSPYCASLGKDKARFADSAVWSRLLEESAKKNVAEVNCMTGKIAGHYLGAEGAPSSASGDTPVARMLKEQSAAIAQLSTPGDRCKAYSALEGAIAKARAAGFKSQDEGFGHLQKNRALACSGQ